MGHGVEHLIVEIPYVPRDAFLPMHNRHQRWGIMVAHRRAGKTVACINDLNRAAITCTKQDGRFAYVAPYYAQAKDVAWTYLKRYALPIPGVSINEGELRVDYPNGARVRLYGTDNYDRMRGGYFDGVILDEYADMHPAAWGEVIRPMLADRHGWAMFIGTPKGRNEFFDLWQGALNDPDWFTLMLKASESGLLDEKELADARRDMTPEQYEQEFECSFDSAILGAYYGRQVADAERTGRITDLEHDAALPVHTAWDLGKDDPTSIWMFQVAPNGIRVLDHYEQNGVELDEHVRVLRERFDRHGWKQGEDWLPHDAKVKLLGMKRTRVEQLQALGRKCQLVPNHTLMDGINAVRLSFPRMWFDAERCRFGLEALRQYRAEYDDKAKVFKPHPKHDWTSHAADAMRYLAMAWREIQPKMQPKPKKDGPTFWADQFGRIHSDMSVREIIELGRRRRMAAE